MDALHRKEKFKTLAEKRVTRAIKDIRLIGNLANRNNYSYDERDSNKICTVLEKEIKDLRARFNKRSNQSPVFKL